MRRILIVEDEDILREAYQAILSSQPYICDAAENGKVALEKCTKTKYDLILLDIMMPVMNGIEFIKHNKTTQNRDTRIIVISNLSTGKELDEVIQLGVDKYFLKTELSPKQIVSIVRYEMGALV